MRSKLALILSLWCVSAFAQTNNPGAGGSPSNPSYTTSLSSGAITNPTSTLTRPLNTTAYASGQAVESSTTAGSSVVPSFTIANTTGGAILPKWTLTTSATTGWGSVSMQVDFWRAAPTYTNGDGGAYLIATGSANYLGSMSCTFTQAGDGAYADCAPIVGTTLIPKLASGSTIYWTAAINSAATPISGQTFTLTAEVLN